MFALPSRGGGKKNGKSGKGGKGGKKNSKSGKSGKSGKRAQEKSEGKGQVGGGSVGVGVKHQMKRKKKRKRKRHGGAGSGGSAVRSSNPHSNNNNNATRNGASSSGAGVGADAGADAGAGGRHGTVVGAGVRKKRKRQSGLQQEFSAKLKGAQFRWLNEQLYTTRGGRSFEMFQDDPDLFHVYHRGFREQASSWTINPLDLIIADLRAMPSGRVIADFGCGEARLAATLNSLHTVHSFDLVAGNDLITACDIANVPLDDMCVDVAIFCLALMGVNYVEFLREAHRTLRLGGVLKIAEVESRFIHGSDVASRGAGIQAFTRTLKMLGFKRTKIDSSHEFFVVFEFVKEATSPRSGVCNVFELKACRYKKR